MKVHGRVVSTLNKVITIVTLLLNIHEPPLNVTPIFPVNVLQSSTPFHPQLPKANARNRRGGSRDRVRIGQEGSDGPKLQTLNPKPLLLLEKAQEEQLALLR